MTDYCDICGQPFDLDGPEFPFYICPECDREKWEENDDRTTD